MPEVLAEQTESWEGRIMQKMEASPFIVLSFHDSVVWLRLGCTGYLVYFVVALRKITRLRHKKTRAIRG